MAQESKTKVVIRKLPPYLKQEGLLEAVNKNFEGAYDWFSYYPGKLSHRRLVHSRAYLNFKKAELVYDFYESFDGHIFVNEKGVQFRAEVEYAPYQKVPKGRNKKDLREGTIFEDPDYLSFLAELENPKPSASASDAKREEAEKAAAKGPIITPLIQFIRDKRASKAAGREKVGPRSTSRDSARKAASAAPLGSASSRSGKGGSNEKGILERKGTGKDDSSRKSSARTSRRDSSSACEADKTDSSSQNAARSTPRDPTGILKRPPTPESEAGPSSDRRKDASARGGPEKRIVKGALASIIGGGLGRPPRGSRDADVRDAGFGDGTSRGGGRQSRRDQRSAPAPSPLPAEPSGWGDLPDGASTAANSSAGPSADWGTENPLAANMAKTGTEPSAGGRKEGASRRGGSRGRSSGGRSESEPQATGWDDVSDGLLRAPAGEGPEPKRIGLRGVAASQERVPSGGPNKRGQQGASAGAASQVTILQREAGGTSPANGDRMAPQSAGEGVSGVRISGEESSIGGVTSRLDALNIGQSTARSAGRGQQMAGSQPPRARDEGTGRGGGRGSRRRGQGRGLAPDASSDAAAAASAAWAALSGATPVSSSVPPTLVPPKSDDLTSARPTRQPRDSLRGQDDVNKASGSGSTIRLMQRPGGPTSDASLTDSIQNSSLGIPSGGQMTRSGGASENGLGSASEAPYLQQSTGAASKGQPRLGRQPRHQGPYQAGRGRGSNRAMLRQGDGPSSAGQGVTESGVDGAKSREGVPHGAGSGGAAEMTGAEGAAAKKQMWVAVQKPG